LKIEDVRGRCEGAFTLPSWVLFVPWCSAPVYAIVLFLL